MRCLSGVVRVANEQRFDEAVALLEGMLAGGPVENLRPCAASPLADIQKFRRDPLAGPFRERSWRA